MEFPGVLKKTEYRISRGSIEKDLEFPGMIKKNHVEFPWGLGHSSVFLALEIPSQWV